MTLRDGRKCLRLTDFFTNIPIVWSIEIHRIYDEVDDSTWKSQAVFRLLRLMRGLLSIRFNLKIKLLNFDTSFAEACIFHFQVGMELSV